MDLSLKEAARRLNGEISGDQIVCPGPNHSAKDRSLSVKLTSGVKSGFVVYSHSGDDQMVCRDYVSEKLGLPKFQPNPMAIDSRSS
jgi:putative DNA primase/helicase